MYLMIGIVVVLFWFVKWFGIVGGFVGGEGCRFGSYVDDG